MRLRWLAGVLLVLAARLVHGPQAAQPRPPDTRMEVRSTLVGDADGNGVVDERDVRRLRAWTATGAQSVGSADAPRLSDVARPCGRIDADDAALLERALDARAAGIAIASECHDQAIGTAVRARPDRSAPVTLDDQFAAVAAEVPEFGGMYIEGGTLKIVLTDPQPAVLERAERALARVFDRQLPRLPREAVAGRYGFERLKYWHDRARALLVRPEIVSLDADERDNRLAIGVEHIDARPAIETALAQLSIPLAAVRIFEQERPILRNHLLLPMLSAQQRPLFGGVEISGGGPGGACSLGFLADRGGVPGFVTASHCAGTFVKKGAPFFQPSSGPHIGVETVKSPIFGGPGDPACPTQCLWADATFVALDPGVTGSIGITARSEHLFPGFQMEYFLSAGPTAVVGDHVAKIGRSTGYVTGDVTQTCVDVTPPPDTPSDGVVTLLCQMFSSLPAAAGDSGGPVVRPTGIYDADLVGIASAGSGKGTVFSPIAHINHPQIVGPLNWTPTDEPPTVKITTPKSKTNIGSGGMIPLHAEAQYFDFESGSGHVCKPCAVLWTLEGVGLLGTSLLADDATKPGFGKATLDTMIPGWSGMRLLTAKATDGALSGFDSVALSSSNAPPTVSIAAPKSGFYTGLPYLIEGDSFDAEAFGPLPCGSLTWTSSVAADPFPKTGCSFTVSFSQTGPHYLTLTGKDSGGLTGTASRLFLVEDLAKYTQGAPEVSWINPSDGSLLDPSKPIALQALVVDHKNLPLDVGWEASGTYVKGSKVTLGTTQAASGTIASLSWTPSTSVVSVCGDARVTLTLRATTANGSTAATMTVWIAYPVC